MKNISWDCIKKKLFLKIFHIKEPNRLVYFFTYLPTFKAELQHKLVVLAKKYNSFLVSLPTAFLIAKKKWRLQGPKIYLLLCPKLIISLFAELFCKNVLSFFIGNKWYAFCIVSELDTENLVSLICKSLKVKHSKNCIYILALN